MVRGERKTYFLLSCMIFLSRKIHLKLLHNSLDQNISNRLSKALFGEQKNQPPTISLSLFFSFFLFSIFRFATVALDMESTVATPKPFSLLKKYQLD